MLLTTKIAFKSILAADPSVTVSERARFMAFLRTGGAEPKPAAPTPPAGPRLIRTAAAARLLAVSPRTIARLAKSGALIRRRLPGRVRGLGFLASDISALAIGEERTSQ